MDAQRCRTAAAECKAAIPQHVLSLEATLSRGTPSRGPRLPWEIEVPWKIEVLIILTGN